MSNGPFQEHAHDKSSYLRPNQPWQCGDKTGACVQGPDDKGRCWRPDQPCRPVRSVRAKKRLITIWIVLVSLAVLTITLSRDAIISTLSPGPLSINHAQVADCKACHTAATEGMSNWIHKAVTLGSNNDDLRCLDCHELGAYAFAAHSTSEVNLSRNIIKKTGNDGSNWKTSLASIVHDFSDPETASMSCASCHREHQGRLHSLKSFDTDKCHTCHQNKFDVIEQSHPEYTRYPYDTPTHIRFDHVSHLEGHFYEDEYFDIAPSGCKQCHDTDQTGEWMLARNFETTCSNCHIDQILGQRRASAKGLAVLSVPEVDVDSIEEAGFFVGEWPRSADGELVPIMRLLLSTQYENPILKQKGVELYDLTKASEEQLGQVTNLVWAIKELFFDIQSGGTALLSERISTAFAGALDQPTLTRLIASLPRDTLVKNQEDWFPNLEREVQEYRSGHYFGEEAETIVSDEAQTNETDINSTEQNEADSTTPESNELLADDDLLLEDDDELFADDEDDGFDEFAEEEDTAAEETASASQEDINAIAAEDWAESGGWYRDGSNIRYRPTDHADPFLKAWLEVSYDHPGQLTTDIYTSLTKENSVGNCMKCHRTSVVNVDHSDINVTRSRWQGFKPADNTIDFNRFSHVSHFSLMTDDGCSSCHLLNLEGTVEETNSKNEMDDFESHFLSMNRDTCTQCHQEGRAPSGCLTCHNYHVDNRTRSIDRITDQLRKSKE